MNRIVNNILGNRYSRRYEGRAKKFKYGEKETDEGFYDVQGGITSVDKQYKRGFSKKGLPIQRMQVSTTQNMPANTIDINKPFIRALLPPEVRLSKIIGQKTEKGPYPKKISFDVTVVKRTGRSYGESLKASETAKYNENKAFLKKYSDDIENFRRNNPTLARRVEKDISDYEKKYG